MGAILPGFFMIIYFGAVISVIIYMIRLFIRLVNAIEKIADSLENRCKSKTFENQGQPPI
jgi:hypothetical protein